MFRVIEVISNTINEFETINRGCMPLLEER